MRVYRWIVLFCLLLTAGMVVAQDVELSETYTYDNGAVFHYPSDWELEAKPEFLVDLYSDRTTIYFADFSFFETSDMTRDDELVDALRFYFNNFFQNLRFQRRDVEEIEIDGREALRYDFVIPDDELDVFIIIIRFSDNSYGLLEADSQVKNFPEEDVVLAIAASFNVPEGVVSSGGSAGGATCTVETSTPNVVRIRVGPGTNRTSIAFLAADEAFTVLGQATDKDGDLWWKLDKEIVAPGKSAAEAWVADNDVNSSGDCASVVDVNAPPVIPIVGAPPPSSSGGGGDTSGGAEPGAGAWTITYASYAPGSCQGTETVNIPIDFASERASMSGSGATIVFDGGVFSRISAGVYQGLFNSPDSDSILATLRVISPTVMSLEYIYNFTIDGTPCSATVNATVTHN